MNTGIFLLVVQLMGNVGPSVDVFKDSTSACMTGNGIRFLQPDAVTVVYQLNAYPDPGVLRPYVLTDEYNCRREFAPSLGSRVLGANWLKNNGKPPKSIWTPAEKPRKTGKDILLDLAECETDCQVCQDLPLKAKDFLPCSDLLMNGLQSCKDRCKRNTD